MNPAVPDRTLGWGLLGTGAVSANAIAPGLSDLEHSRLQAVLSRDLDRGHAFADRFGAAASYTKLEDLLADANVQVVYVGTPNALHFEQALAVLKSGRHALVEKPMVLKVDEGRSLVAAAAEAGVVLGVGFHLRHKPTTAAARAHLAEGRLGRIRSLNVEIAPATLAFTTQAWRSELAMVGGGTAVNQGTHAIDLVRHLTGREIVRVSATADQYPLEEVFAAACTLDDGSVAAITSQQVRGACRSDYQVIGERGELVAVGGTSAAPGDRVLLTDDDGTTSVAGSGHSAYWHEVRAFEDAVLGGEMSGDGEDGVRNAEVVQAIYRSAEVGRAVVVEPSTP